MEPIKVLIIEDSKLMQNLLTKILSADTDIRVVGMAADPLIARELIKELDPDVITLDIMLPHMDGITFLKNLMRLHPKPVVMVSTLTEKGSAIALEALAIGAIDYLIKPTQKQLVDSTQFADDLINAVKNAATANVIRSTLPVTSGKKLDKIIYESSFLRKELIAIGASTGGIEAIESILLQLPKIFPPIIIIQHIKKEFATAFTTRINRLYGLSIMEAEDQTEVLPGSIYIAPGGHHVLIKKERGNYVVELTDSSPVHNHKPSIDLLFNSVAKVVKEHSIGILLTGMGNDGAVGLKAIHDAGGTTIAQDEKSSVVWGMPGSAVKLNAADYIVSLNKIPQTILQILDDKKFGIKSV